MLRYEFALLVTGHRLFLSTAINVYGVENSFLCRFPVKSSWIPSPGVFCGSSLFLGLGYLEF